MDVVPKLGFDSLLGNIPVYPEACSKSRVNPFIINRVISVFGFNFLPKKTPDAVKYRLNINTSHSGITLTS